MRKSARVLGYDLRMSAQDMNALLKEHGYLAGEPGAYGLTEKGMQFGHEEDHHRGPGGHSWYNRDWTTRTWDEEVLDALAADMSNAAPAPNVVAVDEPVADLDNDFDHSDADPERDYQQDIGRVWVWVGVGVAVMVAGAVAAPHAKRLWRRVTKRESDAPEESCASEESAEPVADAVLGEGTDPARNLDRPGLLRR